MLSIGAIDFSNGACSGNRINGMELWIMESTEKADTVINDFKKDYKAGMDPNEVLDQICSNRHYYMNEFTDSDMIRINRKVNEIYNNLK